MRRTGSRSPWLRSTSVRSWSTNEPAFGETTSICTIPTAASICSCRWPEKREAQALLRADLPESARQGATHPAHGRRYRARGGYRLRRAHPLGYHVGHFPGALYQGLRVVRPHHHGGGRQRRIRPESGRRGARLRGGKVGAPKYSLSSSLILASKKKNGLPEVRSMRLFGVEPKSAKLATGFELTDGHFPQSGEELTLDGGSAKSAGLEMGDRVTVGTPEGPKKLKLVGLLRIPGGSFGGLAFGMVPLSFAQKAFDKQGQISGIAVDAAEGVSVSALGKRLDRRLGEGLQAERSETRTQEISGQLQGFKIALLFFAGTSLFVGAFLVFNALSMTILERTRELGMLRALGSTRAMIARSLIVEAMLLGLLGSTLGVLFGYGMAKGLVYLFGRAFLFQITELVLSPFALVSAVVVGVAVTAIAALYPALRAGRVSPVEAMRARSGGAGKGRSLVVSVLTPLSGLVLLGVGAPWIYYLAKNLSANLDGLVYASGIAGVIGAFLGVSLVIPTLV